MEEEIASYRAHVLVLPFQGQGHINPMLQFSKRLAFKGIKVTLAATASAIKSMPSQVIGIGSTISFELIYDDLTHGGLNEAGDYEGFLERFQSFGSRNLTDIIRRHQGSKFPIKCLVYDGNLPWSLDIAKGLGLLGAAFFTQSCATIASYLEMLRDDSSNAAAQKLPELGLSKLPDMVKGCGSGRYPPILEHILAQFSNIDEADWVLFNSFDKLEDEVIKDLLKVYPVRTIGPTVPSVYLDKRIEGDNDYGFNLYQSTGDTCINWLNTREIGSVVYVSFGSAASLNAEQTAELAWGLKLSNTNFLWVVRASEENKLPIAFKEDTSEKGLVVTWSPQLEVLAHKAVGCFMSHCGWNSTVEAVSLGVPVIAMPQFLDQFSDAKFVENVWEVGVRPKVDEKGLVNREAIEHSIREVMEGEKRDIIKRNATELKELAKEAVDEGGSSDINIQHIIAQLVCYS